MNVLSRPYPMLYSIGSESCADQNVRDLLAPLGHRNITMSFNSSDGLASTSWRILDRLKNNRPGAAREFGCKGWIGNATRSQRT